MFNSDVSGFIAESASLRDEAVRLVDWKARN